MNVLKIVGVMAASFAAVALLGGGAWLAYHRRKKKQAEAEDGPRPRPVPKKPPRPTEEPEDTQPRGIFVGTADLPDALDKAIEELAPDWVPPEDEVVDNLTEENMVVFAVKSEPVGNYTETREELITAKVRSVEKTVVRARVMAPVAYAEHHGSHAGHGFRVGDLVEVPRSMILVAAEQKEPDKEGYDGKGRAEQTFKPSSLTKKAYKVRPSTVYDLELPYRTPELEFHLDRKMVEIVKIGEKGMLEQIMFSEDSMRGPVTVRALDNDPEEGYVFVGRWDFELEA